MDFLKIAISSAFIITSLISAWISLSGFVSIIQLGRDATSICGVASRSGRVPKGKFLQKLRHYFFFFLVYCRSFKLVQVLSKLLQSWSFFEEDTPWMMQFIRTCIYDFSVLFQLPASLCRDLWDHFTHVTSSAKGWMCSFFALVLCY